MKDDGKNSGRISHIGLILLIAAVPYLFFTFCLPRNLFKGTPYSTVVTDRSGELLGARIAADGQWRFPPSDSIPEKYATAVIEFEDRYFRYHPGVNPLSIARALVNNLREGHVTSGGSTITMQVARISRGKKRTLGQKLIESILALRTEIRYSKDEILALYASHAPFGGNVVGLEAASWRYFGRSPDDLSWGEAATLAVLPNSPSGIHPGKNRDKLLLKRNRLLERLCSRGIIDAQTCELSLEEPLPSEPLPLPSYASHLVEYYAKTAKGEYVSTSIDLGLQKRVEAVATRWNRELSSRNIDDLSVVVIDVSTGELIAIAGNADPDRKRPGSQVDIARSPRSTGSILKPLLYCALLQEGTILPNTLLPDIPINISGFAPQNFDLQFYGAVPAGEALARSLNVPAVHQLRLFGVAKFQDILKEAGMTTLTRNPSDYGLSLILGGAEGTLLDITRMYASMSRSYQSDDSSYVLHDKAALWHTFEALKEVNRPDEIDWRLVSSVRKVAWKTGTSYGFRDGWAVGVTPRYAVGVWAGNAQGQGVPGLVGARTAGPVLFDIFNLLPDDGWFNEPPAGSYTYAEICPRSGQLRGLYCPEGESIMVPKRGIGSAVCPYHEADGGFRLPPSMEWYYRQHHPEYDTAQAASSGDMMEFIYPERGSTIWIPVQLDGTRHGVVFNLAHRDPRKTVYWHMDNNYCGSTKFLHQMTLLPSPGHHSLTVVDEDGNTISVGFTVEDNQKL